MPKKWTPLQREAHFQVKMYDAHGLAPLLEGQMPKKCMLLWRLYCRSYVAAIKHECRSYIVVRSTSEKTNLHQKKRDPTFVTLNCGVGHVMRSCLEATLNCVSLCECFIQKSCKQTWPLHEGRCSENRGSMVGAML